MGTTIRRKPITTPIPASPDYKFLNITNFGGIEKSSNPFVVSSNTASDCLNVYVDEDNALSTRPRLSTKYDLCKLADVGDMFETIGVYNLHDGYLLHGVENGEYKMFKFVETELGIETPSQITPNDKVPKNVPVLIEHDATIYLICDDDYLCLDNNTLSSVEPYKPTTIIGSTTSKKGSAYESPNILTTSYKETMFWDGIKDVIPVKSTAVKLENNYYQPYEFYTPEDGSREYFYFDYFYSDDLFIGRTSSNNSTRYFGRINRLDNGVTLTSMGESPYYEISYTKDGKEIRTSRDQKLAEYWQLDFDTLTYSKLFDVNIGDYVSDTVMNIIVSSTGKFLVVVTKDTRGVENVTVLSISDTGSVTATVGTANKPMVMPSEFKNLIFSDDDSCALLEYFWNDRERCSVKLYSDFLNTQFNGPSTIFTYFWTEDDYQFSTNSDFSTIIAVNDPKRLGWIRFKNKSLAETNQEKYSSLQGLWTNLYVGDSFAAYIDNDNEHLHIIPDVSNLRERYDTGVVMPSSMNPILRFVDKRYIAFEGYGFSRYAGEKEPLITITHAKEPSQDFIDRKNRFLSTRCTVRFDNQWWFSSANVIFNTIYNNPKYIPESSLVTLGEQHNEITGLCIINDNILAAYKRNQMFIITPITIGDRTTYSYTETKNVVGNDVVNAPILTVLTEMPTIVSYDGIFALNQLENVQSGDRITTLISEAINPLWLKESKSDIDGCLTLNRLYWTYYILPHEKLVGEEDYTKIYLLDNRTQQWYYWELPLLVMNAFVKNDKTHLVDSSGRVFTLETSDLVNEYNADVTEYYDNIDNTKRIIPWHWYSQILSLNTINYSKRLVDTTFILTDTDTQDEYALDYSFKAWRKSVSETNATTINSNIHYVQSTTKRTMIPRFNFIQFRINNTEDDLDNNKLRLVGLGLKYVLLEGLY